jgi:hypothetical protein
LLAVLALVQFDASQYDLHAPDHDGGTPRVRSRASAKEEGDRFQTGVVPQLKNRKGRDRPLISYQLSGAKVF